MTGGDVLQEILKDSNYDLSIFSPREIEELKGMIFTKEVRGEEKPFVKCIKREKDIQLKPEEIVRQLYA